MRCAPMCVGMALAFFCEDVFLSEQVLVGFRICGDMVFTGSPMNTAPVFHCMSSAGIGINLRRV